MKFSIGFGLLAILPAVFAAFGVTTSGSSLVVDSGAGLVTTSKLGPSAPCTEVHKWISRHGER